jgi:DNA-binding MarR family transcriptional regulator
VTTNLLTLFIILSSDTCLNCNPCLEYNYPSTTFKPISGKWYNSKKPPILEIKILKLITLQGESSKTRVSKDLDSNYSDVSDAMDALADKKFIKLSRATHSRRSQKFYKITENGLRALLVINMTYNEDIDAAMVFSRVMLLLSFCSKRPISE